MLAASLAIILSLRRPLISRRRFVAFLLVSFLLSLLHFIFFVEYFEIFYIIPDAKICDRAQQDEEGGGEVEEVAQRLAVVLPAVASAVAGATPDEAGPAKQMHTLAVIEIIFTPEISNSNRN